MRLPYGVDHLVAVGKMASLRRAGSPERGASIDDEHLDAASAAEALRRYLRPQDLVLLKASRAMALEKLGELLRADAPIMAGRTRISGRIGLATDELCAAKPKCSFISANTCRSGPQERNGRSRSHSCASFATSRSAAPGRRSRRC